MSTEANNKIAYLLATKAVDFANDVFKIILMQMGTYCYPWGICNYYNYGGRF